MDHFKIIWLTRALEDFKAHIAFVLQVSEQAAQNLREDFLNAANSLNAFPERNPLFTIKGLQVMGIRKLIVNKRYLFIYKIENNTVVIIRVLDARQGLDSLL